MVNTSGCFNNNRSREAQWRIPMRRLTLTLAVLIAMAVLTGTTIDAAEPALTEIVFYVA